MTVKRILTLFFLALTLYFLRLFGNDAYPMVLTHLFGDVYEFPKWFARTFMVLPIVLGVWFMIDESEDTQKTVQLYAGTMSIAFLCFHAMFLWKRYSNNLMHEIDGYVLDNYEKLYLEERWIMIGIWILQFAWVAYLAYGFLGPGGSRVKK